MLHRTRQQPSFYWAAKGIQPLEQTVVYRCPCWYTQSATGQAVCSVCGQPASIRVTA